MFKPLPAADESTDSDGEDQQKIKQLMKYHTISFIILVGLFRTAKVAVENMGLANLN